MRHYMLTEIKGVYAAGGGDTAPVDVNEDGVVTGADGDTDFSDPMFRRMFVYSNASVNDVVDVAAEGVAINASGDIAGQTFDFGPSQLDKYLDRACVRKGGTLIDLHALMNPVPDHSYAFDINDGGEVVGSIGLGGGRGWLYSKDAELVDLTSTVDASIVSCVGINNSRVIVGMRSPGDQGFLYDLSSQTMTPLPLSRPVAINQHGDVVGMIGPVPAIYSGGQITPINGLGGDYADAADINAARHVIGTARNAQGQYRGFFYDDVGTFDINDWIINKGSWIIDFPLGLNDSDQVVAMAIRGDGHNTGVLLTPVDLPPKLPSYYGSVAKIMVGIIGDGDGWELVNGHWRHVGPGPDDPWRRVWNGLTASQRDVLLGMGIQELASLVHNSSARTELDRVGKQLIESHATTSPHVGVAPLSDTPTNLAPLAARGRFGKFRLRRF